MPIPICMLECCVAGLEPEVWHTDAFFNYIHVINVVLCILLFLLNIADEVYFLWRYESNWNVMDS